MKNVKRNLLFVIAILFTLTTSAQKKLTFSIIDLSTNTPFEIEYKGDIENGMANGKGAAKLGKQVVYEGMWKDNVFEGNGVYTKAPISYNGGFVAGKRSGTGIYKTSVYKDYKTDYYTYDGGWKDDKYSGKGTYTIMYDGHDYDKEIYDGEWLNGERSGQGTLTKDGRVWKGEWKNGLLNGKGTYSREYDHEQYVGDWVDNKKQGVGTYKYGTGDTYEGEWYQNVKEGKGIYTWKSGSKYNGDWVNDNRHGTGTSTIANGETYVGQFYNDEKDGKGVYTYLSGNKYDGDWKKGSQEGSGKYIYADGKQTYTGHFAANRFAGRGKMVYADGKVEDGIWADSKFVRVANPTKRIRYPDGSVYVGEAIDTIKEGFGIMTYATAGVYNGEWHNNERSGQGVMTYTSGNTDEGRYENNFMVNGTVKRENSMYVGLLKDNLPDGWGVYNVVSKKPNGSFSTEEYHGYWKGGKRHGQGTLTVGGCETFKGEFKDDLIPKDAVYTNKCRNGN